MPDFVALEHGQEHRLVGEAKTPWAHNIAAAVRDVGLNNTLRRYLGERPDDQRLFVLTNEIMFDFTGQISIYMRSYKVKYGFYTTYQSTIFLKQELRGSEWVLWHSRPIRGSTTSVGLNQGLTNLSDCVSLRECFLYLQSQLVAGDWQANNGSNRWFEKKKGKKDGPVNLRLYYADDNPATLPGTLSPNPTVPNLPAPQPAPQPAAQQARGDNCTSAERSKSRIGLKRLTLSSRDQNKPTGSKTTTSATIFNLMMGPGRTVMIRAHPLPGHALEMSILTLHHKPTPNIDAKRAFALSSATTEDTLTRIPNLG